MARSLVRCRADLARFWRSGCRGRKDGRRDTRRRREWMRRCDRRQHIFRIALDEFARLINGRDLAIFRCPRSNPRHQRRQYRVGHGDHVLDIYL